MFTSGASVPTPESCPVSYTETTIPCVQWHLSPVFLCLWRGCFLLVNLCRDGRNWDNNSNKDFHSSVEAAATNDSMVEMVFQAMKREAAEADSAAEDRAASRAMRRVRLAA